MGTVELFGITIIKARKVYKTAGLYSTEDSRTVQNFLSQGMDIPQIMAETGLNRSSVHSYMPYSRVVYNLSDASMEADRQRQYHVLKKLKMIYGSSLYIFRAACLRPAKG